MQKAGRKSVAGSSRVDHWDLKRRQSAAMLVESVGSTFLSRRYEYADTRGKKLEDQGRLIPDLLSAHSQQPACLFLCHLHYLRPLDVIQDDLLCRLFILFPEHGAPIHVDEADDVEHLAESLERHERLPRLLVGQRQRACHHVLAGIEPGAIQIRLLEVAVSIIVDCTKLEAFKLSVALLVARHENFSRWFPFRRLYQAKRQFALFERSSQRLSVLIISKSSDEACGSSQLSQSTRHVGRRSACKLRPLVGRVSHLDLC
mmetsp:Transcript_14478/g.33271  ORF Transcript_14478/g.33271 Transcript_14478/m.33271 type:complete len:259 (-) Transcript_14478:551-1327(-)